METTIERVSSPWIIVSIPLLVAGVGVAPISLNAHIGLGIIGGFTLFCLAVVMPLYSALVGGRPRGVVEWGMVLASYIAASASILLAMAGRDPRAPLFLSMLLALAFTLSQIARAKVPVSRLYTLPAPFLLALLSLSVEDQFSSLLAYGAWFSSTLVMVVGAVFLQSLYRRQGILWHVISIALAAAGLILYLQGMEAAGFKVLAASLVAHVIFMKPWSGVGGKRIRAHRGHLAQAAGAAIVLAGSIYGVDVITQAHLVMLGFSAPGVYTQAPLLAPLIVSSTWRRKRWVGASPVLAVASAVLRYFNPGLSQAVFLISLIVLLLELNPSPKRIFYILRYGGEEGYLRSYYDAIR